MRRLAVLLLSGTVLLGACRGRSDPEPPPTTSTLLAATQPAPATTATTVDVSAPPTPAQLQDPAYWNAVLAALNHVVGDVFRAVVSTSAVAPSETDALRLIYGQSVFPGQHQALVDITSKGTAGLVVPPGDPIAVVERIVKGDSACTELRVLLDYGRVNTTIPTAKNVMRLLPRPVKSEMDRNPTPWIIDDFYIIEPSNEDRILCTG